MLKEKDLYILTNVAAALVEAGKEGEMYDVLAEALAIAERSDWYRRRHILGLTGIGNILASITNPSASEAISLIVAPFRTARLHGPNMVSFYITAFVPVLARLGILNAVWKRIAAAERLFVPEPSAREG